MRLLHVLVTIFFGLTLLTGAAHPADAARPLVRLLYFLPNDRHPQPDIHVKLDRLIKDVQAFYADEMERHGYGRKTFAFETDGRGNAVVHRVNALHPDQHYHTKTFAKVSEEISKRFDVTRSVYLIVIETGPESLNDGKSCGVGLPNLHYGHIGGRRSFLPPVTVLRERLVLVSQPTNLDTPFGCPMTFVTIPILCLTA